MKLWLASVVFLIGSNCMDLASSRGGVEANPVMRTHQIPLKIAAVGAVVGVEWLLMRHHKIQREAAVVNFSTGGALVGVSAHNWRVRK
jgi:hypothetical protein